MPGGSKRGKKGKRGKKFFASLALLAPFASLLTSGCKTAYFVTPNWPRMKA
jgi:hypothetical protein